MNNDKAKVAAHLRGMLDELTQPTGIEAIVCADIAKRQALGIKKYGTTVADNPLSLREWHEFVDSSDAGKVGRGCE